jgi:CheY-like chemotaxis protein
MLPLSAQTTDTMAPSTDTLSSTKPQVLLIDDNDTDNLINRRVLEISGYASKIEVCNSGKTALSFIENRISTPDYLPDVIFLDINMPMVDGFVFLLEFEQFSAQISKQIDIVVLSSSDSEEDLERIMQNPRVVKFITKPISAAIVRQLSAG